MFLWAVLGVFIGLVAVTELYTLRTGVPTLASFPSARRKMIEILRDKTARGEIPKDAKILDMGSGSGQLTWHLSRAFPYMSITGVELSFVPWARSVVRQKVLGPENLSYIRADFWPLDISGYDVIVLYVTENIFVRLGQKIGREGKKGLIVLANDTNLGPEWCEVEEYPTDFFKFKIRIYRKD